MNRLLFLTAPLVSVTLAIGLDTTVQNETVQLEFEGTAQAMPGCTLGGAEEGKLGFDPVFPDQLSSTHVGGETGSIEYTLSPNARGRIFLTAPAGFLEAPNAAYALAYVFQPSFDGQDEATAENQIAIPRGGTGELDIHLQVKTKDGSPLPVGGPYVAQVMVTCDPVM